MSERLTLASMIKGLLGRRLKEKKPFFNLFTFPSGTEKGGQGWLPSLADPGQGEQRLSLRSGAALAPSQASTDGPAPGLDGDGGDTVLAFRELWTRGQ